MANYRGGRINEEVRREVSNIIQNEIKDPRLTAMVSVTAVKVTKDLRYAKVFHCIKKCKWIYKKRNWHKN